MKEVADWLLGPMYLSETAVWAAGLDHLDCPVAAQQLAPSAKRYMMIGE